jgi:hypothetical protein
MKSFDAGFGLPVAGEFFAFRITELWLSRLSKWIALEDKESR